MTSTATAGRSPFRSRPLRLAVFVSPHGFGHAARTCALLEALRDLEPSLEVVLFTSVPRWFFAESLSFGIDYRELACDVGMAQTSAVEEDLPGTVERLDRFWAGATESGEASEGKELLRAGEAKEAKEAKGFHRRELQRQLRTVGADAVLCDIAPLGLLAARDAGLPSILVENFTWDWIYEPLVALEPRLALWVERMRDLFARADLRIQAEPVCEPLVAPPPLPVRDPSWLSPFPSMEASPSFVSFASSSSSLDQKASASASRSFNSLIRVPPIARRPRSTVAEVRDRLGLAPAAAGRPMILVSMGGIPWSFENLERWRAAAELDFVVPGGARAEAGEQRRGNLVLLPHHSPVYHPDLVAAADVVVGKLGYSTVAEVVAAGSRVLFLPRTGFREHGVLAEFVRQRLPSDEVGAAELASGAWIERLPALLSRPRPSPRPSAGAAAAANAIAARLTARGR